MSACDPSRLLARRTPFLDVRAPGEFARGAMPLASNLPILDDDERARVGTTYRRAGGDAARALGEELVSGPRRQARIDGWRHWCEAHPDGWLYCWRGGERSAIAQRWLAAAGFEVPRVDGGFKALRRLCLEVIAAAPQRYRWLAIAGRTGSGKTRLIESLSCAVDLEGTARHRGSAFGARGEPQPAPVTFECALAAAALQLPGDALVVEDEGPTIGRLGVPRPWYEAMQQAPLFLLELDDDSRLANLVAEYVEEPLAAGTAPAALEARYRQALDRIRKRLGGLRHRQLGEALAAGFADGDHRRWIEPLLAWYYDPMYAYQLARKEARIVARGDAAAALAYAESFSRDAPARC